MSFLDQLIKKKQKLKPTETIITYADGSQEITQQLGGLNVSSIVRTGNKSLGFVVDNKPDLIPACILESKLYLGSQDSVDSIILEKYKITHILSVGIETPNINIDNKIVKKFISCLDLPETNLNVILKESIDFIENSFKHQQNACILVHCNAGVSRSSSIIIGYLICQLNYTFDDAFNLVKLKRECIQPNQGFLKQLKMLSKRDD